MEIEEKIEELRKEYLRSPLKREIILRQIKCLEYSTGRQLLKPTKLVDKNDRHA